MLLPELPDYLKRGLRPEQEPPVITQREAEREYLLAAHDTACPLVFGDDKHKAAIVRRQEAEAVLKLLEFDLPTSPLAAIAAMAAEVKEVFAALVKEVRQCQDS